MDAYELSGMLFGHKRAESDASERLRDLTISGVAESDSADGLVSISLDGDLTQAEDDGLEHDHTILIPTEVGVYAGDEVAVTLTGADLSTLRVTGVVGDGDRVNARISGIEADYVKATELEADVADIGFLKVDSAVITDIQADTAKVHNLTAQEISAATGYVADLQAGSVTAQDIISGKATIGELEADHVSVSDFQAEQANIDSLQAATADIDTIRANSAKVQNLTAAQLEADHATIGTLDTTYMHANMSNSDVAWISNGTIKDGAITNAMINSVSANKLTAGTIDASEITVTNLNADNITTGTINGQRIGEGSLSLDKLSEDVYTEAEVNNIVDGLNDRIDGAIETFTGTAVPTLNNSPASSWNTTKLRDEHVGDVYYVVNSQSQQNGYCYRFTKSGSTYSWQLIKDSDVTAALSRLTTAEGKITTFDSDISTLKTDTGTLTTKTESLETRMSDAESDILDKVDTTTFNSLEDTVDGHTQTLSQHTTAISNKADSSTVTAVTNRVSKNEQDISGINTTIGELQETVESKADGSTVSTISNKLNTVSDTVDGHTQTLTSVQNTLSTKADSSTVSTLSTKVNTVEDTVDGHTQTISGQSTILSNNGLTSSTNITNRVSSVEQDLSGYKTTVSETYTTKEEFENLEVGGRNLLRGKSDATFTNNGITVSYDASTHQYHVYGTNTKTDANWSIGPYFYSGADSYLNLAAGDEVTLSTDVVVPSSGAYLQLNLFNTSGNQYMAAKLTFNGSRRSVTATLPSTQSTSNHSGTGFIGIASTCRSIDVTFRIKLERGNKATDWTPAPEDIETRVSSAESAITQNANNIALKATKTELGAVEAGSTNMVSNIGSNWQHGGLGNSSYSYGGDRQRIIPITETNNGRTWSVKAGTRYTFRAINSFDSTTKLYVGIHEQNSSSTHLKDSGWRLCSGNGYSFETLADTATLRLVVRSGDPDEVVSAAALIEHMESGKLSFFLGESMATSAELKVANDSISTKVDKDGVISSINQSSESVTINANKINLQGAVTISDLSSDAQSATLNSNISVGSRNLLGGTDNRSTIVANSASASTFGNVGNYNDSLSLYSLVNYDGYSNAVSCATSTSTGNRGVGWYTKAGEIRAGETYTFSCRVKCSIATDVHTHTAWRNGSATASYTGWTAGGTKAISANTWTDYSYTFVPNSNARLEWEFFVAMCITGSSSGATYQIAHAKLEKGNTTTDWTPAPEDVDSAISNAAKTATSYVTDITGGGIMVHPSGNQNTGVRVTSDVDILRSGTSVANYGETARIGTLAGKHVSIDSDSVDLMDGNASLATFGANDTHIGMSGTGNVYMANDKFLLSAETTEGETVEVVSGLHAQNIGENYRVYSGIESTLVYDDDGQQTTSTTVIEAKVDNGDGTALDWANIRIFVDPVNKTQIALTCEEIGLSAYDVWYQDPYNATAAALQLGKPVQRSASSNVSITSTNTWIDGPTVSLDAGYWMVVGVACFNSGSSSGSRKLRAQLRLGSSVYAEGTEVRAATNEYGRVQASAVMYVSSTSNATLVLSSSMSFTTATTSYITAVQLA